MKNKPPHLKTFNSLHFKANKTPFPRAKKVVFDRIDTHLDD